MRLVAIGAAGYRPHQATRITGITRIQRPYCYRPRAFGCVTWARGLPRPTGGATRRPVAARPPTAKPRAESVRGAAFGDRPGA